MFNQLTNTNGNNDLRISELLNQSPRMKFQIFQQMLHHYVSSFELNEINRLA